jgi:hypothetical protein
MMRRSMVSIALALVGAAAVHAAVADVVDIRWDSTGRFEHSQPIAAGKFAEVCAKLSKGQRVAWAFKSTQPTAFNVHFHEGKNVEFAAKVEGAKSADAVLEVAQDQDYCWMWSNKSGDSVNLTFSVQKQP